MGNPGLLKSSRPSGAIWRRTSMLRGHSSPAGTTTGHGRISRPSSGPALSRPRGVRRAPGSTKPRSSSSWVETASQIGTSSRRSSPTPPSHKTWFATNHRLPVSTDPSMWRRICLVPFSVTIPPGERDDNVAERLLAERSGFLNGCLAGLARYREAGHHEQPEGLRRCQRGVPSRRGRVCTLRGRGVRRDWCIVLSRGPVGAVCRIPLVGEGNRSRHSVGEEVRQAPQEPGRDTRCGLRPHDQRANRDRIRAVQERDPV